MTLKSNVSDVRKIAKFSPKLTKKTAFFDFFNFLSKSPNASNEIFFQSFFTVLESYMCNGIKSMGLPIWNGYVRNIAEISSKLDENSQISPFFDFLQNY